MDNAIKNPIIQINLDRLGKVVKWDDLYDIFDDILKLAKEADGKNKVFYAKEYMKFAKCIDNTTAYTASVIARMSKEQISLLMKFLNYAKEQQELREKRKNSVIGEMYKLPALESIESKKDDR